MADYFVLAGLPSEGRKNLDDMNRDGSSSPSGSLSSLKDPITDVTVIMRSEGETIPPGWFCIETTPLGFPADLNHGSIRSPSIFICYRRGRDKPPLVDIGVLYEGKERVMADSQVVETTLLGRSGNVNNGAGHRSFLTYRRARDNSPCNQLVVTDICVLLMNKGETPPHAFCLIRKNLNKGMLGSDVYICYKKSMNRPPLIRFEPSILSRFPVKDYTGYSLPESVPLFCMPMGATIESWSKKSLHPRPVFSTFVLTSEAAVKVYGAAVTFYEAYEGKSDLTAEELLQLEYDETKTEETQDKVIAVMKSICILSRWSFFNTFEKFLFFLYRSMMTSSSKPLQVPLEKLISHFILEVPFPSIQRPKILVQLTSTSDDTIEISQPPEDLPLPLSGASFSQMLKNLGPENCMNVVVLALAEQKILLHSLRPDVLTGVAEAVTSIIFPFVWQCPYIPLCPLFLCDILHAPLPFIVGVDSRYFDMSLPPNDVVCVDLDTNSIYLSESKKYLNAKSLPKKPAKILRTTLEKLFERLVRPQLAQLNGQAYSQQTVGSAQKSPNNRLSPDAIKKNEQVINLEIQEAFVKFMSSVLKGFRSFLRPITRAPTVGATDPWSLFDAAAFLSSRDRSFVRFYELLLETQMFAHFIEQRSFMSDRETCLAFFDECLDLVETNPDFETSADARLIDLDDYHRDARTVFIPAPEPEEGDESAFTYKTFGPLDESKYHAHPPDEPMGSSSLQSSRDNISSDNRSFVKNQTQSPLSRRTKQEIRIAQRVARRHAESPLSWAKCLVSYVYSLWFIQLPAFCKKHVGSEVPVCVAFPAAKSNPLRLAMDVLLRMQSLNLHPMDETCYRVLMRLCGETGQPALAVKVLFEMKRHGVIPNAITYGYYNKAVLESSWPSGDSTAVLLWSKLRNVVIGVHAFKQHAKHGKVKRALNFSSESDGVFEDPGETKDSGDSKECQQESTLEPEENTPKISTSDDNAVEMTAIVRSNPSFSGLQDFNSSAGVLMSTDVQTRKSDPVPCPKKKANRSSLDNEVSASFDCTDPSSVQKQHYMRSFSFGNDSRIIQNLKEGPLKALKHELERNHQVVLEEEAEHKDSSGFISETSEPPFHDTVDFVKHPSIKPKSLTLPESTSPPSSKSTPVKTNRSSSLDGWLKGHTSRFTGKASLAGSMSPLKDALEGLSLFSVEGKVANSIRSGMKYAAKLTESPRKTIPRSSTFDGADQLPKTPSLAPKPSVFHVLGKQAKAEQDAKSVVQAEEEEVLTSTPTSKGYPGASGWSIGKQSDWNTTFKSAATSMASRLSEIKSNLSANSPAKFTGAFTQFATMVADKLPANFTADDEDSTSNLSFDVRRLSVAFSEDEGSEFSREGSITRYPRTPSIATAIFETMERHFREPLEEKSKTVVLDIEIASCSRCYNCSILVFDEEIMEGWSADDSNLNTNCVHCLSKFVPLLTITVTDGSECEEEVGDVSDPFTVPYLSPLVLRKEVENVLENEGDLSLLNTSFIEDHPIIYWNLVWYFERTNLPSHLPGLAMSLFPSLKVSIL